MLPPVMVPLMMRLRPDKVPRTSSATDGVVLLIPRLLIMYELPPPLKVASEPEIVPTTSNLALGRDVPIPMRPVPRWVMRRGLAPVPEIYKERPEAVPLIF